MPLVLQLVPGDDFYIGEQRYLLIDIASSGAFTIEREADSKKFELVDGHPVLLEPEVYASVGTRGQANLARVCIDAPAALRVLRGDLRRRSASKSV
jgi:hypothetical protein